MLRLRSVGTVSQLQESAEAGVTPGHHNSYPGELTERLTELQTQSKALCRCPAPCSVEEQSSVEGQLADEVRALPCGPASGAGPAVKNRTAGAGGEPTACLCLCRTPERAQLALLWQGLGRKMLREEDTVTTSPKERSSGGEALCISPVQMRRARKERWNNPAVMLLMETPQLLSFVRT